MPRSPPAPLHQPAMHRKPRIVEIQIGHQLAHLVAAEQLRILARQPHGVAAPRERVALPVGMVEIDHPALRHHRVEIQLLLQPLPLLQRMGEKRLIALKQVVGPHDRGVAPDIARAEIALLEHRHIGDAVVLRQVIGGGQPVPAAADNDHIIMAFGLRLPPGRLPALVAGQRLFENGKCGIFHDHPGPVKARPQWSDFAGHKSTARIPAGAINLWLSAISGTAGFAISAGAARPLEPFPGPSYPAGC